jgi:NodT family efflux transporter outer membrane factor (OMF) lipoprotein
MDRTENPVKLPVAWDASNTANATASVAKDWWKGFGSPVLEKLIADAEVNNPGIIATEERLKQAERVLGTQRDDLFPEVSFNGSASVTRSGANGNLRPETTDNRTSIGLGASYEVDLWGATAARYRGNLANFIGTQFDADLAHIQLSANVARAYFNLLSIRSRVDIARENLGIAERVLRIFESRYNNGVSRAFDLAQQRTQVLSQRTQLIPLENQMRRAETALGLLLGVTPQDFHLQGEPINQLLVPEVTPWLPSELLLRRPDMASAETDMAIAKANLAVARASLIPVSLSLSASVSQSSPLVNADLLELTDIRNFSLQGALRIAEGIFSHRARKASVLNAKSNEYIALINYANTIRTALKEVDDALADAVANQRTEEVQQTLLEQARRALELAELEYREGSANQQEVLDAQRSLYTAQDSLSQARLNRLTSALTLFVALGGGWTAPEIP